MKIVVEGWDDFPVDLTNDEFPVSSCMNNNVDLHGPPITGSELELVDHLVVARVRLY